MTDPSPYYIKDINNLYTRGTYSDFIFEWNNYKPPTHTHTHTPKKNKKYPKQNNYQINFIRYQ